MKRRNFLQLLPFTLVLPSVHTISRKRTNMSIQLIRHATLVIRIGEKRILIDPMFSPKEAMDPIQNSSNPVRIPMVDLPFQDSELNSLLKQIDAVFVTHTHRDHWDAVAHQLLPKHIPIYCQPGDLEKIKQLGFNDVTPVADHIVFQGLEVYRTKGQHGTGEIGKRMGEVSGFVFRFNKKSIYVAGDTIWCDEVEQALKKYQPDVTVVNAGGAQFLTGDPITMTAADVAAVKSAWPTTKVVAVHMDTVNHCLVKRIDLQVAIQKANLPVAIPKDGEVIKF